MLFSTVVDYIHGLKVERFIKSGERKKALKVVVSSAIINLFVLCFFKYSDFLIENINTIFSLDIGLLNLPLPIGISFYTFQTMSYTIDIYRGDAKAQKSILDFGAYVALFPQLVAGPIVRYQTIATQINKREHSLEKFGDGVNRFVCGLAKKVILSNQLAVIADGVFSSNLSNVSILEAWLGIICYTLQIYFDFGGYSDMAIGLGKMFGFEFLENFNYPYISQTVSEFWRRWHISLGSWFRDYVYIPLGGSRVSTLKNYRNLFVVWFLTGMWHGASWTFIMWGLYFGAFIALEKAFLEKLLYKAPRVFRHIYLLLIVVIGWVFFRAENITQASEFLKVMFGAGSNALTNTAFTVYLIDYWYILLAAIVLSTPIVKVLKREILKINKKALENEVVYLMHGLSLGIYMFVVIIMLCSSSYNPFLYFRF
ncbi:MBOAT family O-acyltransferase [Clostridium sp.]|uniref:MBOAT family O-acyltransferase n=1 Tax=Clostridium sp. TaxID=1506 RepID=UPI003F66FCD5